MGVSSFDRAPQTVLWIEKFKIQNSNLTVITVKIGKTRFWMLKPLTVAKFKFEQWFWTVWSWRSRRYAQIVLQRNTHGERAANVLSCSHFQFDFQFSRRCHRTQKKPLRFKKKYYHQGVPLIKLHQGACNYKHQTPTSPQVLVHLPISSPKKCKLYVEMVKYGYVKKAHQTSKMANQGP